jgi:hypothetical protein
MATKSTPLTASSTIGTWLQDPDGGALIRKLLEKGGFDESTLAPVRDLPLQRLVALSRGQLPQSVVDAQDQPDWFVQARPGGTSDDAGGRSRRHRERQLGSRVAWQRLRPCILGLQARHRQADSTAFMYGPQGIRVNAIAPDGVAIGIPMPATISEYGRGRLARS